LIIFISAIYGSRKINNDLNHLTILN